MAMSGRPATSTSSPIVAKSDDLRNVVLVGPSGSGKTRLFDHLVATTTPGYRAPARGEERSTQLNVASVVSGEVVVNLIDSPGYADFVGELRAGLRAADAALFVVSAADGVDASTRRLWQECAEVGIPRVVAVTKLDAGRADFAQTLADCQAVFGAGVMPLGVPQLGPDGALDGVVDLILTEIHEYAEGQRTVTPSGPEHEEIFETYRGPLIEGIIQESEDDSLLDRYLGGEEIPFETIEADLLEAVARGAFHPVIPLSVDTGAGVDLLLHLIAAAFPPPTRRPMPTVYTVVGAPAPS
jgi:elongation factor G